MITLSCIAHLRECEAAVLQASACLWMVVPNRPQKTLRATVHQAISTLRHLSADLHGRHLQNRQLLSREVCSLRTATRAIVLLALCRSAIRLGSQTHFTMIWSSWSYGSPEAQKLFIAAAQSIAFRLRAWTEQGCRQTWEAMLWYDLCAARRRGRSTPCVLDSVERSSPIRCVIAREKLISRFLLHTTCKLCTNAANGVNCEEGHLKEAGQDLPS